MRLIFLFIYFQLLFMGSAFSQTLSGHVQDAASGEQLIGATVWCEDTKQGVAANIYGFYSLTLLEG